MNLRKYGLTIEQADALELSDPVCAICGKAPNGRRLAIDHDHATGRVRGLLCNPCNSLLHKVETVSGWMGRAEDYLESRRTFEIPFIIPRDLL